MRNGTEAGTQNRLPVPLNRQQMRKPKRRSISYNIYLEKDERPGNAAILTGIAAMLLVMIIIRVTQIPQGVPVLCFASIVFFLFVAAFFIYSLRMQLLYQPYSYNCIYYAGFSLFMFSIAITYFRIFVSYLLEPSQMDELAEMMIELMDSARIYIMISAPFLIAFSLALSFTNIQLIRKEGRRFVNILGIILSFMIIAGFAGLVFFDHLLAKIFLADPSSAVYLDCAYNAATAVFLYFECMLIGVIITNSITVSFLVPDDIDVIIVLGCAIRTDGTPTPILRGRADRAIKVYQSQIRKNGVHPCFVVSGGQGPDEVISEAASMRDYLLSQGVPEDDILMEDKSASTYENMTFSKQVIEDNWHENERVIEEQWRENEQVTKGQDKNAEQDASTSKKIPGKRPRKVFVTTNYHVFRSGVIATDVGITAAGVSAPTKWYFWPNAAVREFVGLLSRQRKKQTIILMALIAAYVAATLGCYYVFD